MKTPLAALAHSLQTGELSPLAHVSQQLALLHRREPGVRAWAHVGAALARHEALSARGHGPLYGMCVGVKDIFDTVGMPTEFGSPLYRGRMPEQDAAMVSLLREKGATILGKTQTTGFAYFDPAPTRNPVNPAHTPGGSSSGSAAAVAAGMAPFAIGSQTVGSVLRPASFCGVVGFKPTFGVLPSEGMLPFAPTLDHPGLFTPSAADMAWLWTALTGQPVDSGARAARVVVPPWPLEGAIEPEMAAAFEKLVSKLEGLGWAVERRAGTPELDGLMGALDQVLAYEAAQTHALRYQEHGRAIGVKLTELVERGMAIGKPDYDSARTRIGELQDAFGEICGPGTVWLTPAALGAAPEGLHSTGNPAANGPFTALGAPAVAVPFATTVSGLPLGAQIAGGRGQDALVLSAGVALETALSVA